jgi:hypothetical protein
MFIHHGVDSIQAVFGKTGLFGSNGSKPGRVKQRRDRDQANETLDEGVSFHGANCIISYMPAKPAPADFAQIFAALKPVLSKQAKRLVVKTDTASEYLLVTKTPSPFPQHKGHPMFFGQIRISKAYVSLHLLPIYMDPTLQKLVSPELKKRKQGMACFNFKTEPTKEHLDGLKTLIAASLENWKEKKWL